MPCTTILVGKNATNDRSTLIARTDDGHFDTKKLLVVKPKDQPRVYKSVISHLEIPLPENPMRYTACPSVDPSHGIWAATGINTANVGMTATETITSNPRVLAADPLVEYRKAKTRREKDIPGGIGEEDIVVLVLPYIHTAREGVERLAALLEQYGTYESNGIAFQDENEVWWMETIGGHHWMARRVPDDVCVINPNQFGMDAFDMKDAFGAKKSHLCSADLLDFIRDNQLDLNQSGAFNPRDIFGSHTDMDHIYNTPRAWFMGRYLTPRSHVWDGPNAEFTPESDNIPWSFVPDRKLAVEDVKALIKTAEKEGYDMQVLKAVEAVNERQKSVLYRKLEAHMGGPAALKGKTIALWGLAFKAETDDMREATSLVTMRLLNEAGCTVRVFDPVAMNECRRRVGDSVTYASDMYDAVLGADALLLLTEWKQFRLPSWGVVKKAMRHPLVIDGRNIYDPKEMQEAGFEYLSIGR